MKKIRHLKIFRFAWIVMAIHILNFSIDPPDVNQDIPEDLSYNEIESITEWIAENVLQITDAFPEHDDDDDNGTGITKKVLELQYYESPIAINDKVDSAIPVTDRNAVSSYDFFSLPQNFLDVFSPPPES
jgi:hypothetical protein